MKHQVQAPETGTIRMVGVQNIMVIVYMPKAHTHSSAGKNTQRGTGISNLLINC